MVAKVNKRLSSRSVEKDDVLEFINRELVPVVEKLRLWTDAMSDFVSSGEGDPNGNGIVLSRPALYVRTDAAAGSGVYYKTEDGTDTGWEALP